MTLREKLTRILVRDLPVAIFLFWLERNCALPWVPVELGFPWLSLQDYPAWARALFDLALLIGVAYWLKRYQLSGNRLLPAVTLPLLVLFPFWQFTGRVLWAIPIPVLWTYAISSLIFWILIGALILMPRITKTTRVILILAAVFSTPMLALDRLLVAIGILGYAFSTWAPSRSKQISSSPK